MRDGKIPDGAAPDPADVGPEVVGQAKPPGEAGEPVTAPDVPLPPEQVTGARRLAFTGGLWNAASGVLPMGSTLALSVVISRLLGPELLGEQSLVAYVASLLFSLGIFSFTIASVQLLASARGAGNMDRLAHLTRWSFWAHVAGGGMAAAVLIGAGVVRQELSILWYIAGANAVVDSFNWAYASRHIAQHGWSATASRRLIALAISPIIGILAVVANLGIAGVFYGQLMTSIVLLFFLRRLNNRQEVPVTADLQGVNWRPVARIWGLFALSTLVTQIVERRLELIFLDIYRDGREIAMYSVAFNIVGIALIVCSSLIGASIPGIAAAHGADHGARVISSLSRATRAVISLSLLLAASVICVGPGLVRTVWGPQFSQASSLVPWLALTLILSPLGQLFNAYWSGIGRLRPVLVAGGVGAVLDIALAWSLIPAHGTTGAVAASLVGQSTAAVLIVVHTFRSGLRLQVHGRRVLIVGMIAVVASLSTIAVDRALDSWPGLLAGGVTFCVVVVLGSRVVGLMEPTDLDWFAETVPPGVAKIVRRMSPPSRGEAHPTEAR